MMKPQPLPVYLLVALHLCLSVAALYGGSSLLLKPDGALLQLPPEWLANTPFPNYTIPAVMLIGFIGFLPGVTLYGLLTKHECALLQFLSFEHHRHWAWAFSVYTGLITISWIYLQQLLTSYFILQPVVGLWGVAILVLTFSPSLLRFYSRS